MKKNLSVAAAMLTGMMLASRIASAALVGVTSTEPSEVYSIDPATGAATLLTTLDVGGSLVGATYLGGVLYASDLYTNDFFVSTVNTASGATTFFSDQDSSSNWHGLASNESAGLLYAIDIDDGYILKSVNSAGVVTAIGGGDDDVDGRGMAYDDTNGVLYATGAVGGNLYVVDTNTGVATLIGDTGLKFAGGQVGLAYDEDAGVLYANLSLVDEGSTGLYTINVVTAEATFIGANNFPEIDGLAWIGTQSTTPGRATFTVTKDFSDENPSQVEVSLSCNTGLILDQSKLISEGTSVEFVVTEFDPATGSPLICEVSEAVPDGYLAGYSANLGPGGVAAEVGTDDGGCYFREVEGGNFICAITNTPAPVTVTIDKAWVFEGSSGPDGIDTSYRVDLRCYGEIVDINHSNWGDISSYNNVWRARWYADGPATFVAEVVPEVYPTTGCWVEESVYDDAVEVDNGCGYFDISAGSGYSCTITNTVFFEGIPTLNQYGIALLALLMLGVGLVGFRRIA